MANENQSVLPYDVNRWRNKFEEDADGHDNKHRLIYETLVDILGSRYVSDDRGVAEAYGRERQTPASLSKGRPEFVVMPGDIGDIQQIVRLANRLNFPFSVMSVGMLGTCFAAEGVPYWCQIDLKRMTRLEIDEKNMYAVVEPYVTNVELQAEAMKKGLYCGIPSAGGTSSVVGNHIFMGLQSTAYRTGYTSKNILGVEWVLPTGEIVRTGSLTAPNGGYFWGEGPGPDSRAVLRGVVGNMGALGIVTRMAVKLFPWPGPPSWPIEGSLPDWEVNLPPERFRFYCFTYPTLEQSLKALIEIAKQEIGAVLQRNAFWQIRNFSNRAREHYWTKYLEGYYEKFLGEGINNHVMVGVFGWSSPKQVEYEELLIREIVAETGGTWVPNELYEFMKKTVGIDAIRTDACVRSCRAGYGGALSSAQYDGFSEVKRAFHFFKDILAEYTPPLIDVGEADWVAPIDLGHFTALEMYGVGGKRGPDVEREMKPAHIDVFERQMKSKAMPLELVMAPHVTGPAFANFHRLTAKIKKSLDPNTVANPTRFIDMLAVENDEA